MSDRIYGVIVEWKTQSPIVMENELMTYDEASERMSKLASRNDVIRAAMFKVSYVNGNQSLIPKEDV